MLARRDSRPHGRAFAHIAHCHPTNSPPSAATCTPIPSSASRSIAPRRVVQEKLAALRHRASTPASARPASSRVIPGQRNTSGRIVGLRADMDALPMQRGERLRAQVALRGPHARLRPRRPHDDAARRGALPARDAPLRRHGVLHLPARRGRLRRRQGDDRGRPVRALSRRARSTRCTTGRGCRRARSASRRARRWPRPTASRSRSTATAGTARIRTLAIDPVLVAGHIITAAQSHRQPQRAARSTRAVVSLCAMQAGDLRRDERDPGAREARRHRAHLPPGDAGHDRAAPAPSSCSSIAAGVRRHARRCITSASIRRPSTLRAKRCSPATSPSRWSAPTTWCATCSPAMGAEDFSFMLQAKPGRLSARSGRAARGRLLPAQQHATTSTTR